VGPLLCAEALRSYFFRGSHRGEGARS